MGLIRAIYGVVVDALFPVPPAEQEVVSLGPTGAWKTLPRAPLIRAERMRPIFAYKDERVARMIWAIKYKRSAPCAAIAGYALYAACRGFLRALPPRMALVVVPMPVSRARRRERGYNQCELIMLEMQKLDRAEGGGSSLIFAPSLLRRIRHTSRQTMKDRAGRIEGATSCLFAVCEPVAVRLRRALIDAGASDAFMVVIDDVITTGSTMKAAFDCMRTAGFSDVVGLSVAH